MAAPKEFLRQRVFAPTTSAPCPLGAGLFVSPDGEAAGWADHRFFLGEPLLPSAVIEATEDGRCPSDNFGVRLLRERQAIGGLPQRLTLLCGVSGGGAKLRFRALFPAYSPVVRLRRSRTERSAGSTMPTRNRVMRRRDSGGSPAMEAVMRLACVAESVRKNCRPLSVAWRRRWRRSAWPVFCSI